MQGVVNQMRAIPILRRDNCPLGIWENDALRSLIWFVEPKFDKIVILLDADSRNDPAMLALEGGYTAERRAQYSLILAPVVGKVENLKMHYEGPVDSDVEGLYQTTVPRFRRVGLLVVDKALNRLGSAQTTQRFLRAIAASCNGQYEGRGGKSAGDS